MSRPPRIGQRLMVGIQGITHEAEGVGKVDGFTVFVPQALPGDTVETEIISVKTNYARGLVTRLLAPSRDRATPSCPYYDECGGCQLMHAAYDAQLRYKEEQVTAAISRIGGLFDVPVRPIVFMREPFRYRNKAQFPVGWEAGRVVMGCYRRRSHSIVAVDDCLIQHHANNQALAVVRGIVERLGVSVYDESRHEGLLRHVLVRHSAIHRETMVVLVINGDALPEANNIAREITSMVPHVVSVQCNTNKQRGNIVLGTTTRVLHGRDHIVDEIGGLKFKVSARSFLQVNPVQTEVLYQQVRDFADLKGTETVFDLYSGVGTIGMFLAKQASHVIGIEIVPEAVRDATENAHNNNIQNASFHQGAAETVVPELIAQGRLPDVCVVDPPRAGCDPALLDTIAHAKPDRVVYVSCNPATLARDLRYLGQRGYSVKAVQPVDMFPHTSHVECVIGLRRNESL